MVTVPAGSYTMGSPAAEAERHSDERQRRVTIDEPFAVGVYEVTFAEWDACAAVGGCRHRPGDGGWGRGRQPVIDVSWDDAQEYVVGLSSQTGRDYRLRTEAEWEYVARAGTTTPFHTGATISTAQANYDGLSLPYGFGVTGAYRGRPIAAGSLSRNAFGLYDVHGNVAELVTDCYDARTTDCTRRVVRGGSWGSSPQLVRSAYRSWCGPTLRNLHNGFRVADAHPVNDQDVPITGPRLPIGIQTFRKLREREYAARYRRRGEPIHLIGVEFGRKTRNVTAFEVADG